MSSGAGTKPSDPLSTRAHGGHRPWSCDTFAVNASHSAGGATLFAKNSDRPARESQPLRWFAPRRTGQVLKLAYVEIEDTAQTIAHLGSSPYWCWGHEMGVNVHGVAIGNEAIFTRDLAAAAAADRAQQPVTPGILGMELLRLGLERAATAAEAIEVMAALVERHGQYGAGTVGSDRAATAYDNSYIVADPEGIWVLETTGRRWAVKQVHEPFWVLSNEPTLRSDWDACSPDLTEHAISQRWPGTVGTLDFAAAVTDPQVPLQVSHIRLQRSRDLLARAVEDSTDVDFDQARRVLSDHYEGSFLGGAKFNPARPDFHTLCMHEHPSGFTWGNTAASMVATLPTHGQPYVWWAATTPCTSVYVPVAVSGPVPATLTAAGSAHGSGPNPEHVEADSAAPGSYWWSFQTLLEAIAGDEDGTCYQDRQQETRRRFDHLQRQWSSAVDALITEWEPRDESNHSEPENAARWEALTQRCVREAHATADELVALFR